MQVHVKDGIENKKILIYIKTNNVSVQNSKEPLQDFPVN